MRGGGTSGGLSCAEVRRGGAGREDDARDQLEICRIATTTTTREYLEWDEYLQNYTNVATIEKGRRTTTLLKRVRD